MAIAKLSAPSRHFLTGVATTALILGMATGASAQNSSLEPTFGTINEAQGFGSMSLTIQAGGEIDAFSFSDTCNGFIAEAPDVTFQYDGAMGLEIRAVSNADTTLVVEMPDGMILCNDDMDGFDPGLVTATNEPGTYAVWVGTFDPIQNNTFPDADVMFAEVADAQDSTPIPAPSLGMDRSLPPGFGSVTLASGFTSQQIDLQAGGDIDAFAVSANCAGYIAQAPDYVVSYGATNGSAFSLSVTSTEDTTLVVMDPGGNLFCNDDDLDLNPGLVISNPMQGDYAVWVGTFNPIQNDFYPEASLAIASAEGVVQPQPDPSQGAFNINGEPTFGRVSLGSDLSNGHTTVLQAGGSIDANTVNTNCFGFVADVPDYIVNYAGGTGDMNIDVTSQEDTTLVVVTPTGLTLCNDDSNELNPGLTISNPAAGDYSIFVGTYLPVENDFYPEATVAITSGNVDRGTAPNTPDELPARARLEPTFGRSALSAGFGSFATNLQAGGDMPGFDLGDTCNGFIAEAPDYVVNYAGSEALRITATSQDDTTMVVIAPDSSVHCNDDFSGLNPGVIGPENLPGNYAIWIGTFNAIENDFYPEASLDIDEVSANKEQPAGAITSANLGPSLSPDPFTTTLAAGGIIDASTVSPACNGYIATQPDFTLAYTASSEPLRTFVDSNADTTLLIRTPSGEVLCNDDFDGLNPGIIIETPTSGTYEVFIGTYEQGGDNPNATLAFTNSVDDKDLPPGAVTNATIELGSNRQDYDLVAGGSFEAYTRFGDACNGFIAQAPDFNTQVIDGGVSVEFTVRSAEDTTLVVRGPDGAVYCDDDSAGDLNPLLLLENATPGTYDVWLGTFSPAGFAPASLSLRDINANSGVAPNVPGGGKK